MIWGLLFGTHDYIFANGGPYGYPRYADCWTYISPSVYIGWRF